MKTANEIFRLAQIGVIDHMDVIDDMYWSLITRFTYFLDLVGPQMPLYFFEDLKEAVKFGEADFFLSLEESEKFMMTKKQTLFQALTHWEAKAKAKEVL